MNKLNGYPESRNTTQQTEVLILGGGITGLVAALYLKQQGVDFILVERHQGTSIYPRSRTIDVRTMELFRGLGLSEALREGGKDLAPAWGILKGNNLREALQNPIDEITPAQILQTQKELQRRAEKSPESICRCTQDISEVIIYNKAREQAVDLRFYHEMLSFEQNENNVRAVVKNRSTNKTYTIAADYMIAADGANSLVRKQLKIPTYGNSNGTNLLNIYFEMDLETVVKGREFSQFLIDTPDRTGFLLSINNKNKWAFHLRYYPEKGETLSDYPKNRLIEILHEVLGITDKKISIIKVLPWRLTVQIARYLRDNRVFIAGDAAHTMTPYLGKGANTGVQDVQNLVWKLSMVLKKQAGRSLLDTYNTERQPVGEYYATLSGEFADTNGLVKKSLMLTKGKDLLGLPHYGYDSSAVLRSPNLPFTFFKGEAGTRMPHFWLDKAHTLSSLDWVKGEFVLIGNGDAEWQEECRKVEQQLKIKIRSIGITNKTRRQQWKSLTDSSNNEALLIRPDDFVAAKITPGNLMRTTSVILGRETH